MSQQRSQTAAEVQEFLIASVAEIAGAAPESLDRATPLVGSNSALDSRDLVELLLATEDFAQSQLGVRFNWSPSGSAGGPPVFATIGSLADHLAALSADRH